MFSASLTREQHTCIITTPGAGCLDHSRRRCGGGATAEDASLTSPLLTSQCRWKLSVSRPQPNTDTVTVVTRPNTTTNYTTNKCYHCYPSCGVLYRPVFCHMTPLLTSGWWWWDHRDLIIDVSAEVVWDLSTRDSCLKVGSCCPIYPYVWVMYYVLSRYLLSHLFNSM